MKKHYDIFYAIILVLVLVLASLIDNAVVKGILLLFFTGVLIFSTLIKLQQKKDGRFKDIFFYGILFFFEAILALSSIFVIASAILG